MKAQLSVQTGGRKGLVHVFDQPVIAVGRHPTSDVQLDPDLDLDVSARHATIMLQAGHWYVRDVGSRNGTWVNGHRIERDAPLNPGDQVQLGAHGPILEFFEVDEDVPTGMREHAETSFESAAAAAKLAATRAHASPRQAPSTNKQPAVSTTQRIRVEVGRQTRTLRLTTVVLFAGLVVVAGVFVWESRRQAAERDREIAMVQARTDSILRAADQSMRALQGQVQGLASALQRSQGEVTRLTTALNDAQRTGDVVEIAALREELASATQSLGYQQMAARVDYRQIVERNQRAIAMLWVQFPSGEVFTGTAFSVRADGMMLTNRHVVAGADGTRRPSRMAIRFADSDQTWRASLLAIADDSDLAVIRVEGIRGDVPTVQPLNTRPDTVRQGDPVAVIGFPLGDELPMSGGVARTTFSAGSVSKSLANLVQVDGYGAEGASGSPIFDQNGEVVAVLYGGQEGSGGRIVYGVPATYALRLLATIER